MSLSPFTEEFKQHRAKYLAQAEQLAGSRAPLTERQVQVLFDQALQDPSITMNSDVVIAIGYAFGELIAARGNLQWKLANHDFFGSEPVLAGEGNTFCPPVYMIARRINDRHYDDLTALISETLETMGVVKRG